MGAGVSDWRLARCTRSPIARSWFELCIAANFVEAWLHSAADVIGHLVGALPPARDGRV
jgi:hypothetical protein